MSRLVNLTMRFAVGVAVIGMTQSSAQTQLGGTYNAPAWGESGTTAWGAYSGNIGQGGWNYNKQLRPNEPVGSVLLPNQSSSSFNNPGTGARLFMPQDTRLKGRDRP